MTETTPLPHGLTAILIPRCPLCGLPAEPLTQLHLCTTCTDLVQDGNPLAIELAAQIRQNKPQ